MHGCPCTVSANTIHFECVTKEAPAQLHDSSVLAAVEVQLTEEAVLYIVEHVAVHGVCGSLTLQLEHNHPAVMTWTTEKKHTAAA